MMKVYLDNAATTKPDKRVIDKMLPYLSESYGNPSSIHSYGRDVRVAVEDARETVAEFINADPGEIYFVSSGTEANNFALFGIAKDEYADSGKKHIITTKAEHPCVIDACKVLEEQGYDITYSDVSENSELPQQSLERATGQNTSLVSVIHINNETGAVNDIKALSGIAHEHGAYFHTDTVQSFGKAPIDVKAMGIDSLCASAHKMYAPKGTGIVYAKSGTPLAPMIHGGSQERSRRGGTENVAGIIGAAEAIRIAKTEMRENEEKVSLLKKKMAEGIGSIDGITINSAGGFSPYILSITFDGGTHNNDAEAMLMYLDINGIAASNGAACTSGTLKPSHVILSMGKSEADASGTIRFSFAPTNTIGEIDYAIGVIEKMDKKFRL